MMADQWIEASSALKLGESNLALCSRLNAGLVQSRARLFMVDTKQFEHVKIPTKFWWATGHEATVQNWDAGDFSTWIDQREHWKAFGVTFALSGVLDMLPFERRAITAHGLSVAGSGGWLPALETRRLAYTRYGRNPVAAAPAIIEMAKLGFIAARAVLAEGADDRRNHLDWDFQEREWDIPSWFWSGFVRAGESVQDWETGRFSGNGLSPTGLTSMTLSGVHFHTASLGALAPKAIEAEAPETSNRGRKPKYDWDAAVAAIWGQILRGALIPDNQAAIERAFQQFLTKGDDEPSESTVRPYANRVWSEFEKEA